MHRGRGFALAGIVLLLLATPLSAQKLGDWHVDSRYGFRFQPPDDWDPIPPQIGEIYEIANFQGPRLILDPKKGWVMDARLWVVRIETKGPAEPEATAPGRPEGKEGEPGEPGEGKEGEGKEEEKPPEKKTETIEINLRARTFEQWLSKASPLRGAVVQSKKAKKLKEAPADEYLIRFKTDIDVPGKAYAQVVHLDGEDIAFVYALPEPKFDGKWERVFKQSAATFRLAEREAPARAADEADPNSPEGQIARAREEASRTPGWKAEATDNYIVLSSTDDARFLNDVKKRIEAIRTVYEEIYPSDRKLEKLPILRVTKDFDEYLGYGGPPGSGGYFNPGTGELVVPCFKEIDKNVSFAVLNHEAFHQYIHFACGDLSPHSWYNEGTGDYFAGMKIKGNRFVLGKLDVGGLDRVSTIKSAIRKGEYAPLKKLVEMTQAEYYANGELHYAQGWSLIYFLRQGKKERASGWDPAWENILPTYFDTLLERKKKGDNDEKCQKAALEEAYRGVDFDALERSWKDFTTR